MSRDVEWTEAQDKALIGLVNQGFSTGVIARLYGDAIGNRSRNAVIGRAGRLNLLLTPQNSNGQPVFWNKARLEQLAGYYHSALGYSREELAKLMACSERTVGLGISKLRSASDKRPPRRAQKPRSAFVPRQPLPPMPAPDSKPVDIVGLENWHCRFIVAGECATAMYCGAQQWPDSSYCGHHHRVCHAS
jgi:hypothetical protein